MVLERSPLAGSVLTLDSGKELGIWRDERELMPETLSLVAKDSRIQAKIVAPETRDPHWRVFIRIDGEPRISGALQLRCGNRDLAVQVADHFVKALTDRPGNLK